MDKIWRVLATKTWPSREIFERGGFLIRNNAGIGGSRANSAEAIEEAVKPPLKANINIERYIIWPKDHELAEQLVRLGYEAGDHAIVFHRVLNSALARRHYQSSCEHHRKMSTQLRDFFARNGIGQARSEIMQNSRCEKMFVLRKSGDEIVGAAYVAYEGEKAWFYSLVVSPHHRKKGFAREIMETALHELSINNVTEISLSVLPSNTSAILLYEGLGFAKISRYYFLKKQDPK